MGVLTYLSTVFLHLHTTLYSKLYHKVNQWRKIYQRWMMASVLSVAMS